jgi:hypothetical protein
MTDSPRQDAKPSEPEIEVRYSAKFLAEKKRQDRKTALWGGSALMLIGVGIIVADINAIRHHVLVHSGRANGILISPWLEMPSGLLALYFGFLLLRSYCKER